MLSETRTILVAWLAEICRVEGYEPTVFYTAVWYADEYCIRKRIAVDRYQLLGIAALFLSVKFHHNPGPLTVHKCVALTKDTFTRDNVLDMELEILRTLEFRLAVRTVDVVVCEWLRVLITMHENFPLDNVAIRCIDLLAFFSQELDVFVYSHPLCLAVSIVYLALVLAVSDESASSATMDVFRNTSGTGVLDTYFALASISEAETTRCFRGMRTFIDQRGMLTELGEQNVCDPIVLDDVLANRLAAILDEI